MEISERITKKINKFKYIVLSYYYLKFDLFISNFIILPYIMNFKIFKKIFLIPKGTNLVDDKKDHY